MNHGKIITVAWILVLLMSLACSNREAPINAPSKPLPALEDRGTGKEGWVAEWERILKAARREGKVEFYVGSSSVDAVKDASTLIKDKFGIDMFLTTGRGVELEAKVLAERRANLYIADVLSTGLAVMFRFKEKDFFVPMKPLLLLPEVLDENLWYDGKLPWTNQEQHIISYNNSISLILTINTKQVQPGEIKSIYDLLNPKWKGKIVISDPGLGSGSGFTHFANLIYNKQADADFFRQLMATNQPVLIRDLALMGNWLAQGKYPVALFTDTSSIIRAVEAGAPVQQILTKEGAFLGPAASSTAILKNAPHPNATRVFINWFLSKEGQAFIQKRTGKQTARIDVSNEGLDPLDIRQPGAKYFPKAADNEEWVMKEQEKYLELARDIFK